MGLPIIDITFKHLSSTAIERSARGIVALILRDTANLIADVTEEIEIPDSLSVENKTLVKEVLKGNVYAPSKVVIYALSTDENISKALDYFENQQFNIICMPQATEEETTAIENFIVRMEKIIKYKVNGIVRNKASNNYQILNHTASDLTLNGVSVTDKMAIARFAGLIEGTPLNQSITFAVTEYDSVEIQTKEEIDARIKNGEIVYVKEMGKIRVGRGVTSMTTSDKDIGNAFKNFQTVRICNLIHNDLRKVIVEKYIGKVPNTYLNKCNLIVEIEEYLKDLQTEQLIEQISYVGVDIKSQKKLFKSSRYRCK